jgi:hypothetical protein
MKANISIIMQDKSTLKKRHGFETQHEINDEDN